MSARAAAALIYCGPARTELREPQVLHVSLNEMVVVAIVWLAITGGPVMAGFLLGLVRRRGQGGRQRS